MIRRFLDCSSGPLTPETRAWLDTHLCDEAIRRHHAHCGVPATWRFAAAIFNRWTLIGVAVVGNPVARALNGKGMLEVNRLCIRRDVPRELAWNAASMLYGWAARTAWERGWVKIITYTRADESGASLIAAGWSREANVRGRGWHGGRRRRSNTNAWVDKVRWSRSLTPQGGHKRQPGSASPVGAAPAGWLGVAD